MIVAVLISLFNVTSNLYFLLFPLETMKVFHFIEAPLACNYPHLFLQESHAMQLENSDKSYSFLRHAELLCNHKSMRVVDWHKLKFID